MFEREAIPRRMLAALRAVATEAGVSVGRARGARLAADPTVHDQDPGAAGRQPGGAELRLSPEQVRRLDEASALPPGSPGWMVEFQSSRDPRGAVRPPTEAEIRAPAERLK